MGLLVLTRSGIVAPPAAQGRAPVVLLSTPLHVDVTGRPAPVLTLQTAIRVGAHRAFPQLEDAVFSVAATRPDLAPLPLGRSATVQADLAVTTPGSGTIIWVVTVTLQNVAMPWRDAQQLFVSDSPETVRTDGIVYAETLNASHTARILYHHQNGRGDRTMWLLLVLSNSASSPARLWVSGATGGPYANELVAGHTAARRFLEQYWAQAGILVDMPPNGVLPLLATPVPSGQVASGLAQIALLQGPGIDVRLEAQFPRPGEPPILGRILPMDTQHQRGTFRWPILTHTLSYIVSGRDAELWIGADRDLLRDETSGVFLQGNYGVTDTFDVDVVNPHSIPAAVALVMHANGGPAGATVQVNRMFFDVPVVQPNAPRTVATLRIAAAAHVDLHVAMMSEAGSNYPVLFTVGPP